jgi:hypothetical protein
MPDYVVPPVVYLVSDACTTTHDMYSVIGRRVARTFVGVTEGWISQGDAPASVDDVAAHIGEIRDEKRGVHIPASLIDEYRIVSGQFEKAKG